ncbi:MAG: DNA polymerase I [Reyranella sp.]|uniref:DNA polymerase I n=1 Tax=Reyranella sp. TaxID=1929291 RepID=UPI0011FE19BA|nr:DNA polymerase I [Reyranella sp.]TAJ85180.1 MAG: DNA polymerase I [Reyranella sp.]TBR29673.1 MAG: DNA polymerase I [Reyranella sp.]
MAKSKAPATTPADGENKPIRHLYLIDGSGYLFRAYHALPPMNRPDGTPINAVFGFCRMLVADLLDNPEIDHIAMILDAGSVTFRNKIYDKYKANRPDPPEDLIPQFPLIREAARAFNVTVCELEGYEADDLIATYARMAVEAGGTCTIVSSDKDLMQLVRPGVELMDPIKKIKLGPEAVFEKFGVTPDKVVDVQALAGDSTDNVPGAPGIGIKTAAQLINEYGSLETLLERTKEIKQPKRRESLENNAELIRISKQLVSLRDDVPAPADPDSFDKRKPDPNVLLPWLEQQGFRTLLQRFTGELGAATAPVTPSSTSAPVKKAEATPSPAVSASKKPNRDFTTADYELIQDAKLLDEWIAEATRAGTVAFDCETDGLDSNNAGLVGVSLALLEGPWGDVNSTRRRAAYLPLMHRVPGGAVQGALDLLGDGGDKDAGKLLEGQIPFKTAIEKLKPLLEDPAVLKVGQNIKYDMAVFRRHGVEIGPVDDTMLISFVLDAGKNNHGMDELAELHLGQKTIKFSDVAGSGAKQVTFDKVPLDKARDYAAEDADVTMQLWARLKPRLVPERVTSMYETIERPLIPVLLSMESAGIKVDALKLKGLSADFEKRLAELEGEIHKIAGREFNVGSPKQLGEILFDEQKLPGGKRNKNGSWATDASVLEDLAAQGHPLPVKILEHRQLAKLKGTYTDALVRQVDAKTGRVHTSYHMTGAATGRLASTDPNLQNIPVRSEEGRKIRQAFIAESGHKLLSADYSQIELRLLAHVADIPALKEAFARGDDIHAITASEMFGVPVKGMDPLMRRRAKAINFGIIYGISAFGLANQLGIGQQEAKEYIAKYFQRYPGIRDYMERTKDFARKHGYVLTPFGRKIHLRYIHDKSQGMRAFAERAAINAPLQGGGADIIKRAMIRLPGALSAAKLKARMLLQVHDELLFEVPEKELDKTKDVTRKVMESAASLTVPLVVDTGVGDNWAAAH